MATSEPPLLRRLLSSRLLHFVVLGGIVFALAPHDRDGRRVRIDSARVERAYRDEQARFGHSLGSDEKQRIMHALVDEELLYREGRRLGLDANDPIVRARVAESLERSLAEAVPASAIDDEELRVESERIASRAPQRVRLALWFVATDRPDAVSVAERVATDVRHASVPSPRSPDRPPIPDDAVYTEEGLARAAGAEVARAAFETPVGSVSDPVASAWGFYVLRPLERRAMDPADARAAAAVELRARKAEAEVQRAASRAASDWEVVVDAPRGEPAYDANAARGRLSGRVSGGAM